MARPIHLLKAVNVPRLANQDGMHHDGGGLYLRVVLPNQRSWVYRYELNGKARTLGLGSYPAISLAKAREKADAARSLKADGRDPVGERRGQRAAAKAKATKAKTFKQCAEAYIKSRKAGWKNSKHADQWTSTLETYAYPIIGPLAVADVDRPAVLRVIAPIWNEKNETASRLRGRVEAVLDFATVNGYRAGDNPARWKGNLELAGLAKRTKAEHHAALPYAALPAFMTSLREQEGVAARALEFAILTAARTGEIIGAPWSEIDGDVWTVPKERMKKGEREHRVPLSKRALAILQEMRGKSEYLFPGGKPAEPLSNMALTMTLRRMKRDDLTVHGFRSTFRDWCGDETDFPREVAEAALAHAVGDKAEQAYRRGDALAKRRKLMEAWAAYCEQKPIADNVLPMRKAIDHTKSVSTIRP
jgi:integrase